MTKPISEASRFHPPVEVLAKRLSKVKLLTLHHFGDRPRLKNRRGGLTILTPHRLRVEPSAVTLNSMECDGLLFSTPSHFAGLTKLGKAVQAHLHACEEELRGMMGRPAAPAARHWSDGGYEEAGDAA